MDEDGRGGNDRIFFDLNLWSKGPNFLILGNKYVRCYHYKTLRFHASQKFNESGIDRDTLSLT